MVNFQWKVYTPTRDNTVNLTQGEMDKIWEKTEKVGTVVLDPETKWFWDKDMPSTSCPRKAEPAWRAQLTLGWVRRSKIKLC